MKCMQDIILTAIDNPSNVVEWALAEMVNNPELLAKAVDEMDRVVGRERLVQESDMMHLNYLKDPQGSQEGRWRGLGWGRAGHPPGPLVVALLPCLGYSGSFRSADFLYNFSRIYWAL